MDYAVLVRGACKRYGRGAGATVVLDNLDMTVPTGSIYGLLGASGCGKTTLLSLIVGRKAPNAGALRVLGGTPGTDGSGVPGPRVGYMPQDIALPGELTVMEVMWYFGWIFNMDNDSIRERSKFLAQLLELPPNDRQIKHLSGGQQRRVSFAAALVHNPELLILDEPTVGLDPILRQNIWDHLVEITSDKKTTIIITTHYIDEARQADKIGLMRKGRLLAEASPQTLLAHHGCSSLEDVFLLLSTQQEQMHPHNRMNNVLRDDSSLDGYSVNDSKETLALGSTEEILCQPAKRKKNPNVGRMSSSMRMKALLYKNIMLVLRNPGWLLFILVFPMIEISVFFLAVGKDPRDLKIAIVNEELGNLTHCDQMVPWTAHLDEEEICRISGISCLFIDKIRNDLAQKEYYRDLDSALQTVRAGESVAVLHFSSSFSYDLEMRQSEGTHTPDAILNGSEVAVYMDMSDRIIGIHVQQELYSVYNQVSEDITGRCNLSSKLVTIPMQFNEPIYGSEESTYATFLAPGIICSMIYFLATTLTCTVLIMEQAEGVWDRNLVSGVTITEVLFCHLICYSFWMIVQLAEVLIFTFLVFNITCQGDIMTLSALATLQGLCGICFGLVITVISPDLTMANYLSMGSFFPYLNLSGTLWPKEGMPFALQWFSKCLPGTLPTESARYILERGWGITKPEVYIGFLITLAWIVAQCAFCIILTKLKKRLFLQ